MDPWDRALVQVLPIDQSWLLPNPRRCAPAGRSAAGCAGAGAAGAAAAAPPAAGAMLDNLPMGSLIPTEVQIGGVTVLDLKIEHYEEIG